MLYIVATPIGNMREITYRAIEVLKDVDFIAAEDTRRTGILLNEYQIRKPLISYQKYNERAMADKLVTMLSEGKDIALVSDAGMPLISDPGSILLGEVIKNELEYTVISGPCAVINALVLSGLNTDNFMMAGFLPEKAADRKKLVEKYADLECTLVFYSPPHNLIEDLKFFYKILGKRRVAIVREISKIHEEVIRGYLGDEFTFTVKGEMAVVIEGAPSKAERLTKEMTIEAHLKYYLEKGEEMKDAVKKVAADRKVAKTVVYNASLKMKGI